MQSVAQTVAETRFRSLVRTAVGGGGGLMCTVKCAHAIRSHCVRTGHTYDLGHFKNFALSTPAEEHKVAFGGRT